MTFAYAHPQDGPFSFESALQRERDGAWLIVHFDCDTGHGLLTARFASRICDIHDFAVKGEHRKGDGRKTLLALRDYFDIIDVPNPVAWRFWRAMQHHRLVQDLFDGDDAYQDLEEAYTETLCNNISDSIPF